MEFSSPPKRTAQSTRPIATLFVLAMVALFFTGCASPNGDSSALERSSSVPTRSDGVAGGAKKAAVDAEDNLLPSEGDIALESEIKALAQSGKWGKKDSKQPYLGKLPDMSKYDFPVVLNNQVAAYLDLFQGEQHDMFGRWLARSTKYLPMIQRELAKAGLPRDLAYLSMIESGYTPTARSSAGAVGLWQFMRETGRHYTLRIDEYVDERRHVEKATKAAVNMLGDLYRDFGDWHLAVAAYNGGPGRVQNGLDRFDAKTFWELADEQYLPLETKRYVPKLIAAIIIAKDPKKYGFNTISYQSEVSYDRLAVTPGLALDAVALVSGSSAETIKELNPELHKGVIPPDSGPYTVRIPVGSKELASRNLALLRTVRDTKYHHHVVKRRENMAAICKHYGVSPACLLKTNNLHSARLTPGRTLRIPYTVTSYALGEKKMVSGDDAAMVVANASGAPPSMAKEETLTDGWKFKRSQDELLALNSDGNGRQAQAAQKPGATASLTGDQSTSPAGTVIKLKADKTKVVAAARTAESGKTFGKRADDTPDAHWYLVKNGETLRDVAKKYKVSTGQIKKWNDLKSNAIHAGLRLRVNEA